MSCGAVLLGGCALLAPDEPPVAVITATPEHGTAPLHLFLSSESSRDDHGIVDYTWEFPDQDRPAEHDQQVDLVYSQSGEYTIRLTVWDAVAQSASAEWVVRVDNTPPVASCRFSNDAPVPREEVLFDASSSLDTDGRIEEFIWDFGDGTTRRGTPVNHVYEDVGLYRVQLTVVDNLGAASTVSHTMTVHLPSPGGGGCGR